MTAPAPSAAPPAVPRPPAGTEPGPPLDTPQPSAGETITLTARGVGSVWNMHSSKAQHRITRTSQDGERQVTEYPSGSWAAAARFLVGGVERELVAAGTVTRGPQFCGDCGDRTHNGACPRHGEIG